MSNQILIGGGAKVRDLEGVITGSTGVLSSVPLGSANGVATLDSGGKVPVSQLPASVVTYLGTWNAATNTPTLANGTGDAGDMYLCNVAGTVNFGAGPITFAVGDWVLYGSGTWQKSNGQNGTVTSVAASITGNSIGITGSPITTSGTLAFAFSGNSTQYINGAGNLVTFPTLTGYVPYTGATSDLDLGTYGLIGDYIKFNTTPTSLPTTQGSMFWNLDKESVDLIMNGVTGSLMQDSFYNVKNQTGVTIPKGTVVRANGTVGASGRILIAPFLANGTYDSKYCMGVTAEDIANGDDGKVTAFGAVRKVDTSAYANGTILYASPTTAGAFTSTEPSNPNNIITVAIVVYSDATNGEIFVRPSFVASATDIQKSLGYTPANAATTLTINGTTQDLSTNRTWNVGTVTSVTATSPLASSGGTTPNLTIQAANISQSGYLTATDWNLFTIAYNNRITSANAPLSISSNAISISQATTLTSGYLSSTDWNTFNGKQNALTLTTTGSSGASTLVGATLNIPTYTLSGLGGVPTSRTLTINGTSYDLSADRTWSISSMVYPSAGIAVSTGSAWGTSITDNSSNWNTAYTLRITTATSPLSIASNTISIAQATTSTSGYLSSTDWNTFNDKQNQFSLTAGKVPFAVGSSSLGDTNLNYNGGFFGFGTAASTYRIDVSGSVNVTGNYYVNGVAITTGGVTGSGTTNYLPKFTGASTIGNSNLINNASGNLGLGVTPSAWVGAKAISVGYAGSYYADGLTYGWQTGMAANAYRTGATTWAYQNTGVVAARVEMSEINPFSIFTAPVGTAGNAISFTQAMTLTAAGRLLLGTTTDAGYKLDVNGTGRFSSNVAIGSTLSSWASGYRALNIGSGFGIMASNTNYDGYVLSNAYYDGSWKVSNNASVKPVMLRLSDGFSLQFGSTAAIGSATTFTEALGIASTGAATFSSSVTANSSFTNQIGLVVNGSTTGGIRQNFIAQGSSGTYNFQIGTTITANNAFEIIPSTAVDGTTFTTPVFKILNTGAATFSSSVTAGSLSRIGDVFIGGRSGTYASYTDGVFGDNLHLGATASGGAVYINTALSRNLIINPVGGNVGIGTSSPSTNLHVLVGNVQGLRVESSNSGYLEVGKTSGIRWRFANDYNVSNLLELLYNNGSGGTPIYTSMAWANNGNVLIGTTTDAGGLLQVAGTVKSSNVFSSINGFMNSYESYNAWELGVPVSTSGLTLKTTSYVTVRINGSVYKLATVN